MAKVLLDAPLVLNPQQALRLELRSTEIDHVQNTLRTVVFLYDSNDNFVELRVIPLSGSAVRTWIENNEPTLLNRLMMKMGITGSLI